MSQSSPTSSFLISRNVVARNRLGEITVRTAFWCGFEHKFGTRRFAATYETLDDAVAFFRAVANWYYNQMPPYSSHKIEIVEEIGPGQYRGGLHVV